MRAGLAEEYNPFAEAPPIQTPAPLLSPAPEPVLPGESLGHPATESHEGHHSNDSHGGIHEGGESHGLGHSEHGHESGHHENHEHNEHHAHHAHHGHHGEHEHEEKLGNFRVTPLWRGIQTDLWDSIFDSMYSVNVGTTFWQPERHYWNFSTQVGLLTEFQYSTLDARPGVNISEVTSIPFGRRQNVRIDDADIYAGNLGLSFAINTHINDHTKVELGFSPILTIGNLSTNLIPNTPAPNEPTIRLDRGASDNGTIVGGDFRFWTGFKTESGLRAGLTGFYGVAETDAIFDASKDFNTYGGGFYVEIPTRFVPHEFPAPVGTFQWFEEILGLE